MEKEFKTFEELVSLAPQSVKDELERLKTYKEQNIYHPESSAYEHIKIVTTRLITTGDIDLIMAALYHDLFKLKAAEDNYKRSGKFRAFGHENYPDKLILENRNFIEENGGDVDMIRDIVKNHMKIKLLPEMKDSKKKAFMSLPCFNKLKIFTLADDMLNDFNYNEIKID